MASFLSILLLFIPHITTNTMKKKDAFYLFDLRVVVARSEGAMMCSHMIGDYFEVRGENLHFPKGQRFSMYALAALLPLLPAKQRDTHKNDWMTTDSEIACPDPHCGAIFHIKRLGRRQFRHADVSAIPLSN